MPNVHEIIRDHVSLSITCVDRLYVNGYLPALQTPGQLCYFLKEHLGNPIPSPALLGPLHDTFVAAVDDFAARHDIPVVQFERGQRKDDIAAKHRAKFDEPEGVVFIGVAQEKMRSFKAKKGRGPKGGVRFDFSRQPVFVNHYYFYLQDRDWGPAFLKVGTYLPYPVKLCLNGHEWAKQQMRRQRLSFDSLDNGFLSCRKPDRLQEICDLLGPQHVQAFFDRWSHRLPWPLAAKDREQGFNHRLTLWQMEISLTQVFEKPVQGRHFFESLIRDNLDLGRPDRVSLLFPVRTTSRTPPPAHGYRTRVITDGVNPSLHVEHRSSHIKQYFKEDRALRTETTINDAADFRCAKGLDNFLHLRQVGDNINRRLLEVERMSQSCALSQDALDRLQLPLLLEGRQRVSALRFGDPRVMAVLHALTSFALVAQGFRNRNLRGQVAPLLGVTLEQFTAAKMTYDLRRLRLRGLIARIPGTQRYIVTTYGLKVAFFYSKVYIRILRPGWAALAADNHADIPRPIGAILNKLDAEVDRLCSEAQLRAAA
jgi:hypothetical protein